MKKERCLVIIDGSNFYFKLKDLEFHYLINFDFTSFIKMLVDILKSVYKNLSDHIILISSDTDLLPVVKDVKENGKIIEYVGFSHQPSVALISNCSKYRLLTKENLKKFVKK